MKLVSLKKFLRIKELILRKAKFQKFPDSDTSVALFELPLNN